MMRLVLALLVCLLVIPKYAYGYLDPATGSMVLQAVIGGFLAALAIVKIYWRKIRALWTKDKSTPGLAAKDQ